MSDFTPKEVRQHLFRLSNTKGSQYRAERKLWDKNSIDYAWALIEALDSVLPQHK